MPVPHFYTSCQMASGECGVVESYRPADSTEDDGVGRLCSFEGFIRERIVVCIYRTLELVRQVPYVIA